jgi:hypothetical protein
MAMNNMEIRVRDNISQLLHRMELDKLKQALAYLTGLAQSDYDWADELSEEQLKIIELGTEQIKNGETFSSEEVHAGVKELLERKRKEQNK